MNYPQMNIEIAEYMGEEVQGGMYKYKKKFADRDIWLMPDYHVNWNSLMPVIMNVFGDTFANDFHPTEIRQQLLMCDLEKTYIAVYKAVRSIQSRNHGRGPHGARDKKEMLSR